MLTLAMPEPVESLHRTVALPEEFTWTDAEYEKLTLLARMLHCNRVTAGRVLVFFLDHIQHNARGLAVAQLPELLAGFPVKWGYKKKRNDFLKLLCDLEFIYVRVNYWAKVRAKTYALGKAGQDLMDRLALLS